MDDINQTLRKSKSLSVKGFRIKVDIPENPKGLCIIIPSGQMGKYDQPGADGEIDFYSSIFSSLPPNGFGVIQPDMPIRDNLNEPASRQHIKDRETIFTSLLDLPLVNQFDLNQIIIIGMSLGGEVIFNSLNKQFTGVILIGSVIDRKIPQQISVENIHLLYGSHDYIAYVGRDGIISPIGPEVYSKNSVKNLINAGAKNVKTTILHGYGHTLAQKDDVYDQPEKVILTIVNKFISA